MKGDMDDDAKAPSVACKKCLEIKRDVGQELFSNLLEHFKAIGIYRIYLPFATVESALQSS
jgi:hypothetical protein